MEKEARGKKGSGAGRVMQEFVKSRKQFKENLWKGLKGQERKE